MSFNSKFVWTDLSTYDVVEAKRFYSKVFGLDFYSYEVGTENEYHIAHKNGHYIAGLYPLPQQFQDKNFPSFWMPYIHTKDIYDTFQKAQSFDDSKVDIQPIAFDDDSMISLIRDPLGAGFTAYEGKGLKNREDLIHGTSCWWELHLSDISKVKTFYEVLFGWKIRQQTDNEYTIYLANGEAIGSAYEFSESFRGGYEYWIQTFLVDDVKQTSELIIEADGIKSIRFEDGRLLVRDSQGASFIITDEKKLPD